MARAHENGRNGRVRRARSKRRARGGAAMKTLTEHGLTAAALERLANAPNARTREIMTSLIRHLHGFVRETALTPAEWKTGIDFLTAVGHLTDDRRQEFVLLSDTLGVSA